MYLRLQCNAWCIKCISSVFSAVISLPKFCWPAKRRSVGCADASHFWVGWLHFLSWVVCRVSVALAWVRIQCWRAWDIQQQHQLRNANYENLHTHLSSAKWIVYWKFIALKVRYLITILLLKCQFLWNIKICMTMMMMLHWMRIWSRDAHIHVENVNKVLWGSHKRLS